MTLWLDTHGSLVLFICSAIYKVLCEHLLEGKLTESLVSAVNFQGTNQYLLSDKKRKINCQPQVKLN